MAYRLIIWNEKQWAKDLKQLEAKRITQLLDGLELLAKEPWPSELQVKKLQAYDVAKFRLRIGRYRVLFDWDLETKTIILYRILHRSKLY